MTADSSGGSDQSSGGFGLSVLFGGKHKTPDKGEDGMVVSGGEVAQTGDEDSAIPERRKHS